MHCGLLVTLGEAPSSGFYLYPQKVKMWVGESDNYYQSVCVDVKLNSDSLFQVCPSSCYG